MVPAIVPDQMFLGDPGEAYRNYDSLTDGPPWVNIYE